MVVADFGAGSGAYTFALADMLAGGHVYAVDVQRDLLRRIHNEAQRRNLANVSVLWGDVEAAEGSKLSPQSCDRVLMSNVLFQTKDKHAGAFEACRVLRPTGKLIVIDWEDPSLHGERIGPAAKSIFPKEAAIGLLRDTGLMLEREFSAGRHHYGLVFTF